MARLDFDGTTLRYATPSVVGTVTSEPFERASQIRIAESTDAPCFEGGFDGAGSHVAVTSCDGPELFTDGDRSWSGGRGSQIPPRIVNGTAYFPGATIRAVDVESGTQRWQGTATGPTTPAMAVDGDMLVQSTRVRLFAFDASTGERLWDTPNPGGFGDVALGDKLLWTVVGRDSPEMMVAAVDTDSGAVQRTVTIETEATGTTVERDASGVLVLTYGDVLRAFSDDGTQRWRFGGDRDDLREVSVTDDAVYVADSETTYEITREEGRERRRWSYGSFCPPVVGDEWLYLASSDTIRRVPLTGSDDAG